MTNQEKIAQILDKIPELDGVKNIDSIATALVATNIFPAVKCCDCKHFYNDKCVSDEFWFCMKGDTQGVDFAPPSDWYCPFGERNNE